MEMLLAMAWTDQVEPLTLPHPSRLHFIFSFCILFRFVP